MAWSYAHPRRHGAPFPPTRRLTFPGDLLDVDEYSDIGDRWPCEQINHEALELHLICARTARIAAK